MATRSALDRRVQPVGSGRVSDMANPFTDRYWGKQLKFLGIKSGMKVGEAEIDLLTSPPLRCDDYFNKNIRFSVPAPVPRLTVSGEMWMTLTAMEVQSAELSIQRARGVVWTAGLGLGYFPLRAAAKRDVKVVNVCEISPDVAELFKRMHSNKRGFDKINIHIGDAHDVIRERTADYCWMDTYQTIHADEIIEDGKYYQKHNTFKEYTFWGWELVGLWLKDFSRWHKVPASLSKLLQLWQSTLWCECGGSKTDARRRTLTTTLRDLKKPPLDYAFCRDAWKYAVKLAKA